MTGYGRGEAHLHNRAVTVEVRAVNNRYLDCSVKMPRAYLFAEEAIKARVQQCTSRGKVDVFLSVDSAAADRVSVSVNRAVADGYYAALRELRDVYGLRDEIPLSLLSRFPDVLLVEKAPEDLETLSADLCAVTDMALSDFDAMRVREGAQLARDVRARAEAIKDLVSIIEARSPRTVEEYRAKLEARMAEVLKNTQIDEARILTEAAIFADKVAINEELVRLRSHLAQLDAILGEEGPIGRKLDFLVQEFNREANTIGSKCNDVDLTRRVVELKGEIEKIREQVQNVE